MDGLVVSQGVPKRNEEFAILRPNHVNDDLVAESINFSTRHRWSPLSVGLPELEAPPARSRRRVTRDTIHPTTRQKETTRQEETTRQAWGLEQAS